MNSDVIDKGPFFHGTKAELNVGDLLKPNNLSNYQNKYLTILKKLSDERKNVIYD